jgi:cleavage and polyadenylation specificity factor subunit 3
MFMIEIAGVKILYTGDYSRSEDRHLMAAEIPDQKPDVLIIESTYGVQTHPPIRERERRFTGISNAVLYFIKWSDSNRCVCGIINSDVVHSTVQRGGRCLIPVFALGRAQELLLILDEHWKNHPELQNIPIYFASSLGSKCTNTHSCSRHISC